jgi:hypothetical protein
LFPRLKLLKSGLIEGISTDILEPYSELKDIMEKFYSLPAITEYYKSKELRK